MAGRDSPNADARNPKKKVSEHHGEEKEEVRTGCEETSSDQGVSVSDTSEPESEAESNGSETRANDGNERANAREVLGESWRRKHMDAQTEIAQLRQTLDEIREHVFADLTPETAPPRNRLQIIAAKVDKALGKSST